MDACAKRPLQKGGAASQVAPELSSFQGGGLALVLIKAISLRTIFKGSDVRLTTGEFLTPSLFPRQPIPSIWWQWKTVLAWPWRGRDEHINALELRAFFSATKWRARRWANLKSRWLHLLDSSVCLGVIPKGRTSSRKLSPILEKIDAMSLAAAFYPLTAFVRSEDNPADAPSRWRWLMGKS